MNQAPLRTVHDDVEEVLLSSEQLQARVAELGRQLSADFAGRDPVLVSVLKGSIVFLADLIRSMDIPLSIDLMEVSSYGSGTETSGQVRILKDLSRSIEGREVIVVEDIIDTGLTLSWLVANLESRGPRSVQICTLLRKPDALRMSVDVKYVGFDIPNEFVVGYGLDYDEQYRNLRSVSTLAPHVYA